MAFETKILSQTELIYDLVRTVVHFKTVFQVFGFQEREELAISAQVNFVISS